LLTDDSRAVEPGCCFVAVRGSGVDGHAFVADAVRGGAAVVVLERAVPVPAGVICVRVSDSREALAKLAAAFYGFRGGAGEGFRLVGITGTNGKTTVAWMLRSILQAAGLPSALVGTVEYDLLAQRRPAPLTTPGSLTLCRHLADARQAGAACAVLEVSSHALDQRRCDGLSFEVGVFTNLSGDHLDYHHTMEAYGDAKRRLFELVDTDGWAVLNLDDPLGASLARVVDRRRFTFALQTSCADVAAESITLGRRGTEFVLRGRAFRSPVRLRIPGGHNVANALAAAAGAEAMGLPPEAICAGLERLAAVPGRLQRVEPDDWPFSVLVDYAHTDQALASVLAALKPLADGRLICVFGCGGDRDRTKRPRMAAVVGRFADVAYVTSDNPRTEDPQRIIEDILPGFDGAASCRVVVQADRARAIEAAIAEARPLDVVLIAGKGHETYQLIGGRVLPFDDREVALRCLSASAVAEGAA
jgi:UDP-N-acetylmuramoyl-L-alanyl-D-glutamate--2,6-diaminopimelate ligase